MTKNLYQFQIRLEEKAINGGREAYRSLQKNLKKKGMLSVSDVGKNLMIEWIDKLAKAIEEEIAYCKAKTGRGRPLAYCHPLMSLVPKKISVEKLAFITIRQVLNSCSKIEKSKTSNVINKIANNIKMELEYEDYKKRFPDEFKTLQYHHSPSKMKFLEKIKEKYKPISPRLSPGTKCHLVSKLMDLLIKTTGAFEIDKIQFGKKTPKIIKMSDQGYRIFEKNYKKLEDLTRPDFTPMVHPPKPWINLSQGGYIQIRNPLVRGLTEQHKSILEKADLSRVFKAINLIQNTAWNINENILDVIDDCLALNLNVKGLPEDQIPMPVEYSKIKSKTKMSNKARSQVSEIYQKNKKIRAKNHLFWEIYNLAHEYRNYHKEKNMIMYFPHFIDWRGRVYPFSASLNPQSNDMAKALLQFYQGKALGNNGDFWLAIHLANQFGKNKISFEERRNWVLKNEDKILDSATKPTKGHMFWTRADNPWCALAACFEWRGFCREGKGFKSHIPITMDGTCNGLQHYSALGRDLTGARSTNLVDSDMPEDIYANVLNAVQKKIAIDADRGKIEARNWNGKLDRKLIKRGVMTTPYGVQDRGRWEQLFDVLDEKNGDKYKIPGSKFENIKYLTKIMKIAITDIVESASDIMDWLIDVAKILSEKNFPIIWTTPVGFIVYQGHLKTKRKEVKTVLQSIILKQEKSGKLIDSRRQKQGLPPNFIQSLDAAHMMSTVLAANESLQLKDFSMIHDSYGVHACHWDKFSLLIRKKFYEIYTEDVIENFKSEILSRLKSNLNDVKFQKIPPKGDYEISDVLTAKYFFS